MADALDARVVRSPPGLSIDEGDGCCALRRLVSELSAIAPLGPARLGIRAASTKAAYLNMPFNYDRWHRPASRSLLDPVLGRAGPGNLPIDLDRHIWAESLPRPRYV